MQHTPRRRSRLGSSRREDAIVTKGSRAGRRRGGWAAPLGAVLLSLWAVEPALADDATCSYGAGTVTVNATPADNFAPSIFREAGGAIRITDSDTGLVTCGAATVTNTDTVVINNTSSVQALFGPIYIKFREPFAPGATDEPGSSDEIEFEANFGPGGTLGLDVTFSTSDPGVPFNVAVGANQVNLNAAEADGIDADVTMNGVTEIYFNPGAFDDSFVASGGAGTPAEPTPVPIFGGGGFGGNDFIVGGNGGDRLFGGDGDDYVDGGGGDDSVEGEALTHPSPAGADTLLGGPGNDQLSGYDGPDYIDGGPGDDRIYGDDFHFPLAGAADVLIGGEGNDLIEGEAGDDSASGGPGTDQILGGLGNEAAAGGPGKDKVKGEDGDDALKGNGGKDRLAGGPGNDSHKGGPGRTAARAGRAQTASKAASSKAAEAAPEPPAGPLRVSA